MRMSRKWVCDRLTGLYSYILEIINPAWNWKVICSGWNFLASGLWPSGYACCSLLLVEGIWSVLKVKDTCVQSSSTNLNYITTFLCGWPYRMGCFILPRWITIRTVLRFPNWLRFQRQEMPFEIISPLNIITWYQLPMQHIYSWCWWRNNSQWSDSFKEHPA